MRGRILSCVAQLALFALILAPVPLYAQVVITELMYDLKSGSDSGREWVEVYNSGTTPVKLTDWKFVENGTNHKITASGGDGMLAANAYAVIADNTSKFKTDWPNFAGTLFDSAFSLGNAGENIELVGASSTDVVSYQSAWGGAGDGNSLNRAPGESSFSPRSPSPGAPLSSSVMPPPPPKPAPAPAKSSSPRPSAPKVSAAITPDSEEEPTEVIAEDVAPEAAASQTASAATSSGSLLWWLAAGGLILLACIALVAAKHVGKKEWDIIEDKSE